MFKRKLVVSLLFIGCLSPCLASEADVRVLKAAIDCPTASYNDYQHRREINVADRSQFIGEQDNFAIRTNRRILDVEYPPSDVTINAKLAFASIGRVTADHERITLICKDDRGDCVDELTSSSEGTDHDQTSYLVFYVCSPMAQADVLMTIKSLSPYARIQTVP